MKRFDHPYYRQGAWLVGAVGAYVVAFFPLYRVSGAGVAALSLLPVAVAGWLFGMRAGLLAGLLGLPLNTLLLSLVGYEPGGWDALIRGGGLPGAVALVIIGVVVGRLRDLSEQVQQQLTQRMRAEAALRENELDKRQILDTALDAIVAMDDQGVIVGWNAQAEKIFGWPAAEAVGQRMATTIIPPAYRAAHERGFKHFLATGEGPVLNKRIEITALHRDGREFPVELAIVPIQQGERHTFTAFVRDITERKRAEQALRESEERYRNIFQTAAVSIWEEDFSAVKAAFDELRAQDVTEFRSYLHEHPDFLQQAARMVKVLDVNEATLNMFGAKDKAEMLGSLDRVFAPETLEILREELLAIAEGKAYFEGETVNQTLQGQRLNVWLTMTIPAERDKLGSVMVSLMNITERKQRERELETLATVSAALRTAPTRAEMLPVILDQLLDLLQADGAALDMRDLASDEIVTELGRGAWAAATGLRTPAGEGVSQRVIATGQPYVSADVRTEGLVVRPDLLAGHHAVACVPLIAQGQPIGVVWVGRQTPFTAADVRLLVVAIADMAANAIHRATLHEQTERRLEHLTALYAIDQAISSSFDLRVTLNILLDQAITQLRVAAAAVLLLKPHTQTLEYVAGHGFRTSIIHRAPRHLGEGLASRAVLERRIISIPDIHKAGEMLPRASLVSSDLFTAYYAAPLIAKGQVKGVLEIFHRAPLHSDPEWMEFLETLAGQAAVAISDAELFEDLQRSNLELAVAYDSTIEGWSRALDLRDKETEGHTQRVTEMTLRLARAKEIDEAEMVHIRRGALLHDIGKMGVPDGILLKPGPLTSEEWAVMRKHPQFAYDMLSPIAYLRHALDIPYCHHEKWDGTGYPRGLKGDQIPLAARLFAVVDVWDALRSDRPYRPGWPEEKVREHIRQQAGTHFDPQVVEAFLSVLNEAGG